MKMIKPDRVVIVKSPPEDKKRLRGPVEIFYKGRSLGICEINHSFGDCNECTSPLELDGDFVQAMYTLQDIEGLDPKDVPYLVLVKDGVYRIRPLE